MHVAVYVAVMLEYNKVCMALLIVCLFIVDVVNQHSWSSKTSLNEVNF